MVKSPSLRPGATRGHTRLPSAILNALCFLRRGVGKSRFRGALDQRVIEFLPLERASASRAARGRWQRRRALRGRHGPCRPAGRARIAADATQTRRTADRGLQIDRARPAPRNGEAEINSPAAGSSLLRESRAACEAPRRDASDAGRSVISIVASSESGFARNRRIGADALLRGSSIAWVRLNLPSRRSRTRIALVAIVIADIAEIVHASAAEHCRQASHVPELRARASLSASATTG